MDTQVAGFRKCQSSERCGNVRNELTGFGMIAQCLTSFAKIGQHLERFGNWQDSARGEIWQYLTRGEIWRDSTRLTELYKWHDLSRSDKIGRIRNGKAKFGNI